MTSVLKVAIGRVIVPEQRLRALGDVYALAESINESGLLNPIVVTPDLRLIAGAHRLEACKQLGWDEIEVRVLELDGLHAELAEIDENLIRAELTALERSEHLARRKAIYEELHPDTRSVTERGGPGRGGKTVDNLSTVSAPSFAEDTAAKTGVSARTVRREVKIANSIAPEVRDALRDTPLADKKTALMEVANMSAPEQMAVAQVLAAPPASPLRQALAHSGVPVRHAAAIQQNPELRASVESGERTIKEAASLVDLMDAEERRRDEATGESAFHKMTRLLTDITDVSQIEWDAVHDSPYNRARGSQFRDNWLIAAHHMLRLAEGRDVYTIDALTVDA